MVTTQQLLRLKVIRSCESINDQLTPAQVQSYLSSSVTFADFKNIILSQLRTLMGTPNWYDALPTTIAALNQTVTSLQQQGVGAASTNPATCAPTDAVGSMVYLSAPQNASGFVVTTADASSFESIPAVGLIISKSSSTACVVQTSGEITGLSGLVPDAPYFLGNAGSVTTLPIVSESLVYLQQVGVALSTTSLLLAPTPPMYKRSFT